MNWHVAFRMLACLLLASSLSIQNATAQGIQPPGFIEAGSPYSQEELDQLLAPIALYADPLISVVLMAATYPMEVVEAERFVDTNRGLSGAALASAINPQNWDSSVKSLTEFPSVLAMMAQNLDWTQTLGDAVLAQPNNVMDTIQSLRWRAQAQGTLRDTAQQRILLEQQIISIQPVQPEIIYVPYYDPNVVYGSWWIPSRPPYYWTPPVHYRPSNFGETVVAGIAFGVGVTIAHSAFSSYWRPDWHSHTFISINSRGPAWRHDPTHRRGVVYHDKVTRERFGSRSSNVGGSHDFRGRTPVRDSDRRTQPRTTVAPNRPATPVRDHHDSSQKTRPSKKAESGERGNRFPERDRQSMSELKKRSERVTAPPRTRNVAPSQPTRNITPKPQRESGRSPPKRRGGR